MVVGKGRDGVGVLRLQARECLRDLVGVGEEGHAKSEDFFAVAGMAAVGAVGDGNKSRRRGVVVLEFGGFLDAVEFFVQFAGGRGLADQLGDGERLDGQDFVVEEGGRGVRWDLTIPPGAVAELGFMVMMMRSPSRTKCMPSSKPLMTRSTPKVYS